MKKENLYILLLCFGAILFVSCSDFDNHDNNKDSNTEHISNKNDDKKSKDYMLWGSLAMNGLCFFLIIGCYKRCSYVKDQIHYKNNYRDNERGMKNRALTIENVRNEIQSAFNRFELSDREVSRIVNAVEKRLRRAHSQSYIQSIGNNIGYSKNQYQNANHGNKVMQEAKATEITKKLYASQWNTSEGTFCNILDAPNDGTVYELEVSDKNAKFYLYKGAINKVLGAPGFLEFATDLQMKSVNNSTARTELKGKAIMNTNGKWIIEQKTRVIFE